MIIENPMVTGYGYYGEYELEPAAQCEGCQTDMYQGSTRYRWNKQWICDECLIEAIFGMDAVRLASEFDIETEDID